LKVPIIAGCVPTNAAPHFYYLKLLYWLLASPTLMRVDDLTGEDSTPDFSPAEFTLKETVSGYSEE
jgi:hypothetical protein